MRTSSWVMIAGAVIAVLDSTMITGTAGSAVSNFNAKVVNALAPIDSKLPFVQNTGVWIIAVGAVMRFGFGK